MDIPITITVPTQHVAEAKQALLRANPIPGEWTGTENEWLIELMTQISTNAIRSRYNKGIELLHNDSHSAANQVIT